MTTRARRQIHFMGNSQGRQLFMQAIVAAIPVDILRVDTEKNVRRSSARMNVQERGVLATLLFAVIHAVDRRSLTVQFVVVNRRRDTGDHGKQLRMFEGQSERPLASHADALEPDGSG